MAYFTLIANGVEIDRYELTGPMTLGRSPECDVPIHDILMSRQHCRIAQVKGRWRITDIGSKNGTHFNWRKIDEHFLFDGDSMRMGRTYLEFRAGSFVPSKTKARKNKVIRPADPHEALTGTVSDFVLAESGEDTQEFDGAPSPPSRPGGPAATKTAAAASVSSVLDEISSSWDSIVATASRPVPRLRNMPRPRPVEAERGVRRRRPEPDLTLHATAQHLPYLEMMPHQLMPARRRSILPFIMAACGIALATLVVLFCGWVMMQG